MRTAFDLITGYGPNMTEVSCFFHCTMYLVSFSSLVKPIEILIILLPAEKVAAENDILRNCCWCSWDGWWDVEAFEVTTDPQKRSRLDSHTVGGSRERANAPSNTPSDTRAWDTFQVFCYCLTGMSAIMSFVCWRHTLQLSRELTCPPHHQQQSILIVKVNI